MDSRVCLLKIFLEVQPRGFLISGGRDTLFLLSTPREAGKILCACNCVTELKLTWTQKWQFNFLFTKQMRNKEERGRVFVCRALGKVTHHGFQKCRFPEGFNYELELEDTLLLKSAVGSCLIHILSSGLHLPLQQL